MIRRVWRAVRLFFVLALRLVWRLLGILGRILR